MAIYLAFGEKTIGGLTRNPAAAILYQTLFTEWF
jgi:hypothetical protein